MRCKADGKEVGETRSHRSQCHRCGRDIAGLRTRSVARDGSVPERGERASRGISRHTGKGSQRWRPVPHHFRWRLVGETHLRDKD